MRGNGRSLCRAGALVAVVAATTCAWGLTAPSAFVNDKPGACASGVEHPQAAFFVNRAISYGRNQHMRGELLSAGLRAVRVQAVDAPRKGWGFAIAHVKPGEDSKHLRPLRRQARCATILAAEASSRVYDGLKRCVHPSFLRGDCGHRNAYQGDAMLGLSAINSSDGFACNGMVANFLSKLSALRQIQKHLAAGIIRPGFVLVLEDDTTPFPDWRTRYCAFMDAYPHARWEVAKVDSWPSRTANHTLTMAALGGFGMHLPLWVYDRDQVVAGYSDARLNKAMVMARYPFAWGTAALLLHTRSVPVLSALLNQHPVSSADILLRELMLARKLRLVMSEEPIFDSTSSKFSQTSVIRREFKGARRDSMRLQQHPGGNNIPLTRSTTERRR